MKRSKASGSGKARKLPEARVHVIYTGRVQGVGFRHTAEGCACKLGLTGWVKNLRDGSVEMVAEGPKKTIEALLDEVCQSSMCGRHIKKADCRWETPTGEYDDFLVEFDY